MVFFVKRRNLCACVIGFLVIVGFLASPILVPAQPVQRTAVRAAYIPATSWLPAWVAKDKGFFTEHGLDVMPAAVHIDGTTRPQILPSGAAPVLMGMLEALREAGLPPVLVNTSFNGLGEPIVNTAADAVHSFRELGLDFLVLGDWLVRER